jgi:hypothetical protein
MSIDASRKIGQSAWRATISSYSGITDTATVYVYCSSHAPITTTVATTRPLAVDAATIVEASCHGAGTTQSGGFSTAPKKAEIFTSFRLGNAWRVRGSSVVAASPTATSYAYCAMAGRPIAREGEPVTATDDTEKTVVSAPCGGGAAPLAGGFRQSGLHATPGSWSTPLVLRRVNGRWRAKTVHRGPTSSFVSIAYCA